jgi:hypothetical protein
MGANSAMLVYVDSSALDVLRSYPILDKPATRALAERLFPDATIEEIGDELLVDAVNPPDDLAYIGCFPNLDLVCSWRLMPDRPSKVEQFLLAATDRRVVQLLAVHGDADWCTYGVWQDGELTRGLSVCPDPGVIEDIGEHLSFERPFWAGEHPAEDEGYTLPFHPLELGEAALRTLFGIVLDGGENLDDVDPELIPVVGYRIT